MPSEHARLSPSAAERWMACPASIRMEAEVPPEVDSKYAREGTLAHTRAEIEARYALGMITKRQHTAAVSKFVKDHGKELTDDQLNDIQTHAKAYAALLVQKRDAQPHTNVFLEQRVFPGVPQCFGTGDAVLVSPVHVEIVDFKYGQGVTVVAEDNPQLMLYGLGALEGYGDVVGETEQVVATIYQPRVDEEPSSASYTPAALLDWRATKVLPQAELALSDDAPFNPGEVQCRWCPAAGICRPRMEAATAEDFSTDPDIVSDAELGEIMQRIPAIKDWVKAVETVVFHKLWDQGHDVPGWKVVLTAGKRSIQDHEAAVKKLIAAGYTRDDVARYSTKTLGDLEKLVGKTELPALLGDLLKKGDGTKALAPAADPRPAITSLGQAAVDFAEEEII